MTIAASVAWYAVPGWWSIAIATLAVLLSLLTYSRGFIPLDISFSSKPEWVQALLLESGSSITNSNFGIIHVNIQIINSSDKNISLFNFSITDQTNGENIQPLYKLQIDNLLSMKTDTVNGYIDIADEPYAADTLETNYCTIPARSVKNIDVFFIPEKPIQNFGIMFKLTKRHINLVYFWPPNWRLLFQKNSKHQIIMRSFSLEDIHKPDYEKLASKWRKIQQLHANQNNHENQ